RIAPESIDADNFASLPAIFKNSAGRHAVADFLRDLQFTYRGAITSSPVADTVFGSRNRINRDQRLTIKNRESLILHADDDTMLQDRKSTRLNSSHRTTSYAV